MSTNAPVSASSDGQKGPNSKRKSNIDTPDSSCTDRKDYPRQGALKFETSYGFTIYIYVGNIALSEARAITTGEGTDVNQMSQVTRTLGTIYSPTFNEKRYYLFKMNVLKEGNVYHTVFQTGKQLSGQASKDVLHAVVPNCEDRQDRCWTDMMTSLYKNVCDKAEELWLPSVAIPLLGTGQSKGSTCSSVKALAAGLKQYGEERNCTHAETHTWLEEIQIAVLDDDLKEEVFQEIRKFFCALTKSVTPELRESQPWDSHRNVVGNDGQTSVDTGNPKVDKDKVQEDRSPPALKSDYSMYNDDQRNHLPASSTKPHESKSDGKQIFGSGHTGAGPDKVYERSSTTESDNVGKDEQKKQAGAALRKANKNKDDDPIGASSESKINKEESKDDSESCPICMDKITDPKVLAKCKHVFCRSCIETSLNYTPQCPTCKTVYGQITGNMPEGTMTTTTTKASKSLPGYDKCGTIVISYNFRDGIQSSEHPNPGHRYRGTSRTAYLPDNPEGRKVLELLKVAWDRRLTFTIGRSTTTGQDNVVTWNDIHHKTSWTEGEANFGYPDMMYLSRVTEELASKDVTDGDLDYFQ